MLLKQILENPAENPENDRDAEQPVNQQTATTSQHFDFNYMINDLLDQEDTEENQNENIAENIDNRAGNHDNDNDTLNSPRSQNVGFKDASSQTHALSTDDRFIALEKKVDSGNKLIFAALKEINQHLKTKKRKASDSENEDCEECLLAKTVQELKEFNEKLSDVVFYNKTVNIKI